LFAHVFAVNLTERKFDVEKFSDCSDTLHVPEGRWCHSAVVLVSICGRHGDRMSSAAALAI
jgi:hypothetical protein